VPDRAEDVVVNVEAGAVGRRGEAGFHRSKRVWWLLPLARSLAVTKMTTPSAVSLIGVSWRGIGRRPRLFAIDGSAARLFAPVDMTAQPTKLLQSSGASMIR
jgi:hypothetical protein